MHKLIIEVVFLAILWLSIELTVLISNFGQEESDGFTQEVTNSTGKTKMSWFEAYIVIPFAKRLSLWIEKRGRSP